MTKLISRIYPWKTAAGDISGGFLAALIALPYGLAMASLMGLPPILGLFTSLLSAPITALLGRNPVLIGGASSVTVPFVAAAVQAQGIAGAAKVTMVAAIVMLIFSVLRWGRYATKVPNAVMAGFSCGIGGMMVISQLKHIFGLRMASNATESMAVLFAQTVSNIGQIQWTTTTTAIIVILCASAVAHFYPRMPAPLLGIVLAILTSNYFGWSSREIGLLPDTVPPFVGFSWSPADVFSVLPAGFGLAFVSSVNLLVTSRVVQHFQGRHVPLKMIDADRELGAYGIANLASGMFGAPMSVGIPARSVANIRCGGSTRMSILYHAAFLLVFLKLGGGTIAHIPVSALAGVTAWMGFSLMSWGTWARLPKMRRLDAAAFLTTAVGTLLFNAIFAVAAGCALYGLRHLYVNRLRDSMPDAASEVVS